MKRLSLFLALCSMLVMASCDENLNPPTPDGKPGEKDPTVALSIDKQLDKYFAYGDATELPVRVSVSDGQEAEVTASAMQNVVVSVERKSNTLWTLTFKAKEGANEGWNKETVTLTGVIGSSRSTATLDIYEPVLNVSVTNTRIDKKAKGEYVLEIHTNLDIEKPAIELEGTLAWAKIGDYIYQSDTTPKYRLNFAMNPFGKERSCNVVVKTKDGKVEKKVALTQDYCLTDAQIWKICYDRMNGKNWGHFLDGPQIDGSQASFEEYYKYCLITKEDGLGNSYKFTTTWGLPHEAKGVLPEEIGDLCFVTTMTIMSYNVSSPLPKTIVNIESLRSLELNSGSGGKESLITEEFPNWLKDCKNLQEFWAPGNHMTGCPEPWVANLRMCGFYHNDLDGELEKCIWTASWFGSDGHLKTNKPHILVKKDWTPADGGVQSSDQLWED